MRSFGFAKKLIEKLFEIAHNNNSIYYIKLECIEYNQKAIDFYVRNGFKVI